jgi:hypothetical protein
MAFYDRSQVSRFLAISERRKVLKQWRTHGQIRFDTHRRKIKTAVRQCTVKIEQYAFEAAKR